MKKIFTKNSRGYTLVEMIVSLAIFAVVAVVALGATMKIISANRKAQTLQSAFTNINLALEMMSREMRTGTEYHCDTSRSHLGHGTVTDGYNIDGSLTAQTCNIDTNAMSDPNRAIALVAFKTSKPTPTVCATGNLENLANVYRFIRDTGGMIHLQKAEQKNCAAIGSDPVNGNDNVNNSTFNDILSTENVVLTDYRLGVAGGTDIEPYAHAFVRLIGYAGDREKDKTYFDVQTSITQRTQ